jgi:hypothetical protein
MKSLIAACFVLLVSIPIVKADVAKPKQPEKAAKYVLHTSLEIATDPKAYEAKLQITESELKSIRAALDGAAGNQAIAASITHSPTRTIIAGLLMFLSVSIAGVLFARSSSFGRAQKVVGAVLLVAVVGAAAIITRGNAGPPGSYRWRNLPQALAEGKATAGGLDIEIIPDDAKASGANMRLIIPLKKSNPGEE